MLDCSTDYYNLEVIKDMQDYIEKNLKRKEKQKEKIKPKSNRIWKRMQCIFFQ